MWEEISKPVSTIVELGAFMGASTLQLLEVFPEAIIVSVDHWKGSPEHHQSHRTDVKRFLPNLYDRFIDNCWDYQDRLIPMRENDPPALQILAEYGLKVDLFYVDASHLYEDVKRELQEIKHCWPEAIITGDDYKLEGVNRAVSEELGEVKLYTGRAWIEL